MGAKTERAMELFNAGFGCAQSIVAAFGEEYDLDEDMALKLTTGLNAGCRSAELCGAVSGAAIVVGLKYGQYIEGDMGTRANCNAKLTQFLELFRADFDNLVCRDLLGFDVTTPEGQAEYAKMVRAESPCAGFVRRAAEILEDLEY